MKKRIIILSLVALFAVFALPSLIGCNTAPVETEYIPEVVQTPEPVLLLCVVCEEYKEEHEHCYDWQASMIERLNRERAEREAAAEALAEAEALHEQERLDAWLELPEEEREELMAQARAEVDAWWEGLIQEQYENMIAAGFVLKIFSISIEASDINLSTLPEASRVHYTLFPPGPLFLSGHYEYNRPDYFREETEDFADVLGNDIGEFLWRENESGVGYLFPGRVVNGYSIDGDRVVPYEYVLCITRLWVAECECVMPPDWGQ